MPLLADGLHNLRHALRSWAVLIHWLPTASSMSSLHLLLGLPLSRFPSLGVHSDVIFAHLVFFILATCPAHCPFMHFTFSIISITICKSAVFQKYMQVSDEVIGGLRFPLPAYVELEYHSQCVFSWRGVFLNYINVLGKLFLVRCI